MRRRNRFKSDLGDLVYFHRQYVCRKPIPVPRKRLDQCQTMKPQNLLTGLPVRRVEAVS